MGLPSSITLGTLVFDDVTSLSGSSVIYYAPSPQGDLVGRPSLRFSHEKTKAGIVRTLVSLQIPCWNAGTAKYEGFIKGDVTLNRSQTGQVSLSKEVYSHLDALLGMTTVTDILAVGSI